MHKLKELFILFKENLTDPEPDYPKRYLEQDKKIKQLCLI